MRVMGNAPDFKTYKYVGSNGTWDIYMRKNSLEKYQEICLKIVSQKPRRKANFWLYWSKEKGLYNRTKEAIFVLPRDLIETVLGVIEKEVNGCIKISRSTFSTLLHH